MHRSLIPVAVVAMLGSLFGVTGCGAAAAAGPGADYGLSSPDMAMAKARAPKPERAFESGERADYVISVLGIPAAEGHLTATEQATGDWTFEAGGEALPWLAIFYDLRLEMVATTRRDTLVPKHLSRDGVNGGYTLKRNVRFQKKGRVRISAKKKGSKRLRRYRRRTTRDANDPLSVVFAMRQALLEADDPADLVGKRWHAFDGAWTRRLTVLAADPRTEILETDAGTFRTRKLRVRIHRIQIKNDRRIPKKVDDRTWNIWATADGRGLLVAAEGQGPFGFARAELTKYRPASAVASARP